MNKFHDMPAYRITSSSGKVRRTTMVWVVAMALAALLAFSPGTLALTPVVLQLDWTPNTNHTGFYVALEKGWYEEAGIDLTIVTPGADTNVLALVGVGRAHFGVSFQEFMTSARIEGVPVISIAAILQHNTSGFASIGRDIESAADFVGKRFGGTGMPIERAILKTMMEAEGADVSRLAFVNIPYGIDLVTLLQRDIDLAWIYYGWQGIEAELRGVNLDVVMMWDYFDAVPDYYTPVLVTSESLAEDKPDLVRAFTEATVRGYVFASENPAEAADILLKYAPEYDPELVHASQKWLSPHYIGEAPVFGHQRLEVWQEFGDWMYEHGLIDQPFDGEAAFTNRFLPGE